MFLLVCFHCLEVYAYEEGHRCTDTEGNECETDPANLLLVHAMPSNRIGNRTNPSSGRSSSTKNDFMFSVVKSRSGSESTNIESQAKNTDAGLRTTNSSLYQLKPIPTTRQDGLLPPEQAASNLERNSKPRDLCVEISQSTSPNNEYNMQYTTFKNSSAPRRSKSEIYAATFQGISNEEDRISTHYDKAKNLDATIPCRINKSCLPSTSQELSRTISDRELVTGQAVRSLDNSPAVPGPSGIQRNMNPRNSNSTFSKKLCDTCEKEYIEGFMHKSERICIVCEKRFQCRTQYNEHLLEHPTDFTERCWVCSEYIHKHLSKCDKKIYRCCVCDVEDSRVANLKLHNHKHEPGLFCQICREEYDKEQKIFHNRCFPCKVCEKVFKCQPLLEDHSYIKHLSYLKKICVLCQRGVHKPVDEHKDQKAYQCCECPSQFDQLYRLQNHLLTHIGLELFKCDKCPKRFSGKYYRTHHSKSCFLNFRCEICRLRFDSDVSLHAHLLKNHIHTW